jgi:hypothetical protein
MRVKSSSVVIISAAIVDICRLSLYSFSAPEISLKLIFDNVEPNNRMEEVNVAVLHCIIFCLLEI